MKLPAFAHIFFPESIGWDDWLFSFSLRSVCAVFVSSSSVYCIGVCTVTGKEGHFSEAIVERLSGPVSVCV